MHNLAIILGCRIKRPQVLNAPKPKVLRTNHPLFVLVLVVLTLIHIIIIIIDKTDAGLNGLCIRDITLIYDVINSYNNY